MKSLQSLSYKTLFTILFFALAGIVFFLKIGGKTQKVSAAWWDEMWHYRKAISITNSSGSNLTDFQVAVSIGTSQLITDGKMQSDCDDIRITDINGNLLPYWIETETCNTNTTRIWTKINNVPSSGSVTYVYYGNSSAISQTNSSILPKSCSNLNPTLGSGAYYIDPDQNKNTDPIQVYCDMTTGGGGWTLLSYTNDYNDLNFPPAMFAGYGTYNPSASSGNASIGSSLLNYINVYDFMATDLNNAQPYVPNGKLVYINNYTGGTKIPLGCLLSFPCGIACGSAQTSGLTLKGYSVDDGSQEWSGNSICHLTYATNQWSFGYNGGSWLNSSLSGIYLEYWTGGTPSSARRSAMIKGNNDTGITHKIWVRESTPTSISYSSTPQSEESGGGPIAYWKFDEGVGTTAYDSAGSNNGTISGATWQTEDQCISGKCLKFDGVNDFINAGTNPSLNFGTNSFSVFTWVKFNSNTANQYFINGRTVGSSRWHLYVNSSNVLSFWITDSSGATANATIGGYNTNQWYYLGFVRDKSTGKVYFYKDGKLITSVNDSTNNITSQGVYLGAFDGSNSWFNGLLDEPKIYPYARTADQIKQDYNSRGSASSQGSSVNLGSNKNSNSLSDGLVGYWKMDENTGTVVGDSSGVGNTGTFGIGDSAPGWTNGKYGIGISFDGVNDYINFGNPNLSSLTSASVSFWRKGPATPAGWLLFKGQSGSYYIMATSGGTGNFYHDNTGGNKIIYVDGNVVTAPPTDNNWHHYVISDVNFSSWTTLQLTNYPGWHFKGNIDEVRLYNRALSPAEVSALYNSAPGPVGYWDFNDGSGTTAIDKSGNNNNGTWSGTGSHWTQGKIGSAGNFNNCDVHSSTGPNPTYAGTVEAWVKVNSWESNYDSIVFKGPGTSWSSIDYGLFRDGTNQRFLGTLNNGTNNLSGSGPKTPTINLGQWYHIAFTWDSSTTYIYTNGIGTSVSYSYGAGNRSSNLRIGRAVDGSSYPLNGLIDEVKIYNYARTQKQIIEDMNSGAPATSTKSMLTYYKFDEGSGTTAYNSGNGGSALNGIFGTGNSAPTWVNEGKKGKALSFDGINDYVQTATLPSSESFSISVWFKPGSSITDGQRIYWGAGTNKAILAYSGTTKLQWYVQTSNGSLGYITSTNTFKTTDWNQATLIYNGSSVKLYINGILDPTTGSLTGTSNSSGFYLGTNYTHTANWFNGLIDEFKFYNYALTADEIKQDYNAGSAIQFGSTTQNIGGTTTSLDYCIPGDTTYCAAPIAEWKMDEGVGNSAVDTSGNNNTGTISGATWTQGKIGKSLNFNGTSDYVSIPNYTYTTNATISVWVKGNYLNGNQIIIGSPNSIALGLYNSGSDKALIGSAGVSKSVGIANNFINDSWNHLTVVYDNSGNATYYCNGQLLTNSGTNNWSWSSGAYIGRRDSGNYFKGQIDQLKIYNYARTPAQIAYDYNRGAPVAWWKFDECQGSVINDSSGNGNTGTLSIGQSGTQNSIGTCQIGTSAAWTNGASGKINSSINFDGSDDYITINDSPNIRFNTNDFSITAWVKHASNLNSIHRGIFTKGNTSTGGFSLYINYDTRKLRFINQNSITIDSNQIIADNSWHHVVASRNSNDLILYVDGKLDNSSPGYFSDLNLNNSATALIGLRDGNRYFNGQIDDIRIYNYALTDEQVKTVYNNGAVNFN